MTEENPIHFEARASKLQILRAGWKEVHLKASKPSFPTRKRRSLPSYLAPTPLLDEAGFLADFDGSLIPNAPLLINLLLFKYSSTSFSTLPLSCFGFLYSPHSLAQPPSHQESPQREEILRGNRCNIPHIKQLPPPRPLLRPLHHLNRLHIRTINLDPHLHPHHQQFIP